MPDIYLSPPVLPSKPTEAGQPSTVPPKTSQNRQSKDFPESTAPKSPLSQEKSKPKGGFLSAFVIRPAVTFETQGAEEKILLLLRKHPVTNFIWLSIAVLGILFSATLLPLIINLGVFALPLRYSIYLPFLSVFLFVSYALINFIVWYFNVYIVTDERVLDVDFYSLIYKRVSEAQISKIQDVTYQQGGVVRMIFNYGDVLIQTAAEQSEFEFEAVPQPAYIARMIGDLMQKEEREFEPNK